LRRLSLVALAATALLAATAAVALAANIRHEGSLRANNDGKIRFTVVATAGVVTEIDEVKIRRIPYDCDDGSDGLLMGELAGAPVEDGEFVSKGPVKGSNIAGGKLRLEGRLRRGGEVGSGTLRVKFRFDGGPECRTGERRWRSEETG
jgi:hypothetical protein